MSEKVGLVRRADMGEVWPVARPGYDDADLGKARIEPTGPFEICSYQTLTLTYTVGRFGLDDTGGIKIVRRFTNDGGRLQITDPRAPDYVTAEASNGCRLTLYPEPYGHQRPWDQSLRIMVTRGYMRPGDTITIVFGDRTGGSPGMRIQTFQETAHEFRVLVDACATGQFYPTVDQPHVEIVPGPAHVWKAVLPTLRRPGSLFKLGIKAEDEWGNPTQQAVGRLRLDVVSETGGTVDGLPDVVDFPAGKRAFSLTGLSCDAEGVIRIRVVDDATGAELAVSNPLVLRDGSLQGYWGDMHGQSGETVGINRVEDFFDFARDLAFLDAVGHQGNDFHITNAFWAHLNELTAAYSRDGEFVTFPGYEWSGNTPMGGDHNVYYRHEGRPIHRSSHALLADRTDLDLDANTSTELIAALKDEECFVYAHIGGRPADISQADGDTVRTAVEIHSDWGTFEWIMTDSFDLGYRLGLVANSDGHKGRPGASYPGASQFGALGGITCFLTEDLTRDGIFDAHRRRHHYGTTGCRMALDVTARFDTGARQFTSDPRYMPVDPIEVPSVMMGDIAQTDDATISLDVSIAAHAPILRVDVLNGASVIASVPGYRPEDLGSRYRVAFHGAEYRGRGRQTSWKGTARFPGAAIERFEKYNMWNLDRQFDQADDDMVVFNVLTTGNHVGFDVWLDGGATADIDTDLVSGTVRLDDLGPDDHVLDAGGLDRRVTVTRLPDRLTTTQMDQRFTVDLKPVGDNPIWVRVRTEDGFTAWSSPMFLYRREP